MIVRHRGFSAAQRDRFKAGHRGCVGVLEEVAAGLGTGITEREATLRITRAYRALGVNSPFHLPAAFTSMRHARQPALSLPWNAGDRQDDHLDRTSSRNHPVRVKTGSMNDMDVNKHNLNSRKILSSN